MFQGIRRIRRRDCRIISGLLILNDPETGIPILVMDCTWITAMHTSEASAVAANARDMGEKLGLDIETVNIPRLAVVDLNLAVTKR